MTFKLYVGPTGGNPVWIESRTGANAVPVTNGLFHVLLGSVTPIDLSLLRQELWLGISVNGDIEMTPREKLGSVPFAAVAETVTDTSLVRSLNEGGVKVQTGVVEKYTAGTTGEMVDVTFPAVFAQPPTVIVSNCTLSNQQNWPFVNWMVMGELVTATGFRANYSLPNLSAGTYRGCWIAIGK
jgi:hypothetical protein